MTLNTSVMRVLLTLTGMALSPIALGADLLPSEATTLMIRAMAHAPDAERTTLTGPIISRMRTDELDDVERFLLGEAHYINLDPEPARDVFWEFRDRADDFGRVAWQKLIMMRINAFGMIDQVTEKDIPLYRSRFGTSPHDRWGISRQIMQAARLLVEQGEADRALDLVVEEVRRHSAFDAPYFAYFLPDRFAEIAKEQGRGREFRGLRKWVREGIASAIEARLRATPSMQPNGYQLPGATLWTLFEDQALGYHEVTALYLELQSALSEAARATSPSDSMRSSDREQTR